MSTMIIPMEKEHWPIVSDKIGLVAVEFTRGIVAIKEDGEIAGAVVFQNWAHSSAMVHIWVEYPMVIRGGLLEEACRYFFDACGCTVMIGMVVGDNPTAIKFNKHVGFKEVYRIKDGFKNGVDWIIMEARREDLRRWFNETEEVA